MEARPLAERNQPLWRVVRQTARQRGLHEYDVLTTMTCFFEALAAEMARGRAVRINGFGMFAPYPYRQGVVPKFAPAAGLIAEVLAAPVDSSIVRQVDNYRSNNKPSKARHTDSRTFTTMQQTRDEIKNEAHRDGLGHCGFTLCKNPRKERTA